MQVRKTRRLNPLLHSFAPVLTQVAQGISPSKKKRGLFEEKVNS